MLALKQEQLFEEIDILPIDLKTKIVDKILASITPSDATIDSLWIQEVNKRKSEIETNQVSLVDGDIRRCLTNRFPFGVIYYQKDNEIIILAVMQLQRKPNYWKSRKI